MQKVTFSAWRGMVLAGLLWAASLPASSRAADVVERIDPPSWWVGMSMPDVQLLVHGNGVAALTAGADYPGVLVSAISRLDSPNYLFVTLHIAPGTKPGVVPIAFKRGDRVVARRSYALEARRDGSADRRGFDASDAIYLVMPDRFANGNPDNDRVRGLADGADRQDPDARHGGDLAGVAAHLDYIERMGFTQLWMTPVLENAQPKYSYHGYSITDHYKVDPRFGTNEQLRQLSSAARERGIGLIWDVVVNHIGSGHWWMQDLPSASWLSQPDPHTLTNHQHTTVQDPYAAKIDRELYLDGWFSPEMPDLRPMTPELGTYLIQNAIWWIEYADLSGLRMDTYSYSDKRYMAEFTRRVRAEYPRINIVGEEWRTDPALVAYWQAGKTNPDQYVSNLPSLMDFPIQRALILGLLDTGTSFGGLNTLYEVLGDDFLYPNPRNLVVFSENHDTDRTLVALHQDVGLWRLAQVYVATMRGIPQLLYGSEALLTHEPKAGDGRRRQDFPGGWQGDSIDAFTGRGEPAEAVAAQQFVSRLLTWRKSARAVHSGSLTHYAPVDGTYSYFRTLGDQVVMVILNPQSTARTVDIARFRQSIAPGSRGTDVLTGASVELGSTLVLPARSAVLYDLRSR